MSSFNEHDKQLLATLLNQADAVASSGDNTSTSQSEDYPGSDADDHAFIMLDHYINSEMGDAEQMQFEQQTSASGFHATHSAAECQSEQVSSFQSQGNANFNNQQGGYSGAATVQSTVQMEQSSTSVFSEHGHSFQQVPSSSDQLNNTGEQFQAQSTGFHQQYGSTPCTLDKLAVSSGFPGYSQQYSADTASAVQGELSGQTSSACFSQHSTDASVLQQNQQQATNQQQTFPQVATQHSFYQQSGQTTSGATDGASSSSTPSMQGEHVSPGAFGTHVLQFQQSYLASTCSPAQPTQSAADNTANFSQSVTDYCPQQTNYTCTSQTGGQGDQGAGMLFTDQMTGFVSGQGQVSGFQKSASFTQVPTHAQSHFDSTVLSSPANSYQQPSPVFSVQPSFSSQGQHDQNPGSTYPPHTADFNSVTSHSEQNGNSAASGFQAQASPFASPLAPQKDTNTLQSSFQQSSFCAGSHSTVSTTTPQPMQVGGSGPSSLETEALEFLQKTLQAESQQTQVTNVPGPVHYHQISGTSGTPLQRDQPMETQQSPYLASDTGGFQRQSQQQTGFHDTRDSISFSSFQAAASHSFPESLSSASVFQSEVPFSSKGDAASVSSFSFPNSTQSIVVSLTSDTTAAVAHEMSDVQRNSAGFDNAMPAFSLAQQATKQTHFSSQTQNPSTLVNEALSNFVNNRTQIQTGASVQQSFLKQESSALSLGQFQSHIAASDGFQMETRGVPVLSSQVPFLKGASVNAPGNATVTDVRSPSASGQDSSQTNTALSLLSTVLQQIQALLPQATNQPAVSQGAPPVISSVDDSPEAMAKLLQSQNSAQQVLCLLQQQAGSSNVSKISSTAQSQQQLPQQVSQQPNFLIQQNNQPNVLVMPQTQPGSEHHAFTASGKPLTAQMSSSMVTSLASSLSSLGVTISSDGQFVIGQQPIKVLLGPTNASSSTLGIKIAQASESTASLTPTTTVSFSGQQCLTPPLQALQMGNFPTDLENISINPLPSAAVTLPSTVNLTHSCSTYPTAATNIGSFSGSTVVTPTASFTEPLPVVGVSLGNLGSNAVEVSAAGNSETGAPVANIFYPEITAGIQHAEGAESSPASPVQAGNFLNVTAGGSASMLLNAFSIAVSDKSGSPGFKMGSFGMPSTPCAEGLKMSEAMDTCESLKLIRDKPMDTDKMENLPLRQYSRKSSADEDLDQKSDNAANSMLRKMLTMKDDNGAQNSKASSPSPDNSPLHSPREMCFDGNTQATLIERSENLKLNSDAQDDQMQPEFWTSIPSFANDHDEAVPSKVHRGLDDLDTSSKQITLPSVEKLFDAGGAASSSAFVFTKFGAEVSGVRPFGISSDASPAAGMTCESGAVSSLKLSEPLKINPLPTASIRPSNRRQKDPGLNVQYPSKFGEYELRILAQPEEQHRARYLTEGSRGAVKDRSQQGYPIVKLFGYEEPTILQVFIGNEGGRVKPHGFYQACKVCGKNSIQCTEREIEGTNVIEIELSSLTDMHVNLDCVGILKLRNADVEKRIGPSKAKAKKKNSTKARLIFRCTLRKHDGTYITLQIASTPILCTQPIGQPEICRMSLSEICVNQTSDLFIIGKNFLKGTQVMFEEVGDVDINWRFEAELEVEYFQQTHLICRIPEYPKKDIKLPVKCQIVVSSGGKMSDPQDFVYKPAMVLVKEESAMETEPSGAAKSLPFVSPVALQLNRLVERTQRLTTSSSVFQLPPGAVPTVSSSVVVSVTPKLVSSSSTQPLSSVLKPATLTLPGSQPLTLGPLPVGGDMKGAVPVQFVMPPAAGSTVGQESRKQLLLMPNPPMTVAGGITSNSNNKVPQSVFTLTTLSGKNSGATPIVSAAGAGLQPVGNSHAANTPTTTAQMIVILTGAGQSSTAGSSGTGILPVSLQQPSTSSGQGVALRFLPYRR